MRSESTSGTIGDSHVTVTDRGHCLSTVIMLGVKVNKGVGKVNESNASYICDKSIIRFTRLFIKSKVIYLFSRQELRNISPYPHTYAGKREGVGEGHHTINTYSFIDVGGGGFNP